MDDGTIYRVGDRWLVWRKWSNPLMDGGEWVEFEPPAFLRTPYYIETAPGWEPIRWDGANHMKIEKRPAPDLMDAVREIAQGTRRGQ